MAASNKIRLFVGGIDFGADKAHVESLLSPHGVVIDVFLPEYRRYKGKGVRNRGFAFVEMYREDGERAITALNDTQNPVTTRRLIVKEADQR